MDRVVVSPLSGARRGVVVAAVVGLLATAGASAAVAQDPPACDGAGIVADCVLPAWPESSLGETPSIFGAIKAGRGTWVTDETGDVPPGALDIAAVGVGTVAIDDPGAIRTSADLLKLGKAKKAVRNGKAVLVRVVMDRPLDQIQAGHAGIHVATDIDGARNNNAPSGVGSEGPFVGTQDIYSATYATTTEKTKLLDSDLARGWYKGKDPFVATWSAPNVLDVLVRPQAFGDGLRVVTYTSAVDGGYDSVSLGPNAIPVDGRVGLLAACGEAAISGEPFTVRRLVENGQTLKNVAAPASWHGAAAVPVDDASRSALEGVIAQLDDDDDGRIGLASTVSLFEDGRVIRQRPAVELALDGDHVQLAVELGLTRRGYNVVRDIRLESTGDATADAYLERAARAMLVVTPPFRSAKKAGPVSGSDVGTCATLLIEPPAPEPDADEADGTGGSDPASDDDAAASA